MPSHNSVRPCHVFEAADNKSGAASSAASRIRELERRLVEAAPTSALAHYRRQAGIAPGLPISSNSHCRMVSSNMMLMVATDLEPAWSLVSDRVAAQGATRSLALADRVLAVQHSSLETLSTHPIKTSSTCDRWSFHREHGLLHDTQACAASLRRGPSGVSLLPL